MTPSRLCPDARDERNDVLEYLRAMLAHYPTDLFPPPNWCSVPAPSRDSIAAHAMRTLLQQLVADIAAGRHRRQP